MSFLFFFFLTEQRILVLILIIKTAEHLRQIQIYTYPCVHFFLPLDISDTYIYFIMALLSKSKKTPSSSHLQEWPALPTFNNTQTMYVDIKQWLRHPRPRELEKLPITIPTVIASIVKESTRNERYLQTQESQVVDAQIDVRSSKTE